MVLAAVLDPGGEIEASNLVHRIRGLVQRLLERVEDGAVAAVLGQAPVKGVPPVQAGAFVEGHRDVLYAPSASSCAAGRSRTPSRRSATQAGHRRCRGSTGGRPPGFDRERYKARHKVECRIGLLKQARGVATRYEKLAVRYETTIQLTLIRQAL
ncbi:transposase [Streptomyces sp. 891-h]|nr:transposase [Streptomyces sp. 891-h]